jgi:orotidine-5'-phosphate decarboxylase
MTEISPVDRIFCAIDTPKLDDALMLADLLAGEVGAIKLGKRLFPAPGPDGVKRIADCGHKIFLDLKFHDIPNTVAGGIRAALRLNCAVMTVHASGGQAMLEAARDAAAEAGPKRPKIVAVTVLTSLDDADLAAVGQLVLPVWQRLPESTAWSARRTRLHCCAVKSVRILRSWSRAFVPSGPGPMTRNA